MTKAATRPAFERFWAAYPVRPDNPKAAARLVFERRVREGADAEEIAAAARRYAEWTAMRKTDSIFIPHARTWISQRRYEDFLEDAVAAPAPVEGPHPDHPLHFLLAEAGEAYWMSWIAPLVVDHDDRPPTIVARTRLALDRVCRDWRDEIDIHFGAEVGWAVAAKGKP